MMESIDRSVLDTPLEPVIGLAEGETRWRSMTVFVKRRRSLLFQNLKSDTSAGVRPGDAGLSRRIAAAANSAFAAGASLPRPKSNWRSGISLCITRPFAASDK
jgi:hypothetical protein